MPTPDEYRRALTLVADAAVRAATGVLTSASVDELLVAVPEVIAVYSDGTAALAADHYDDLRETARARGRYSAQPVVNLRDEKIRRGILWTVESLETDVALATERLAQVVQLETARPFRDTITTNRQQDPEAVGWRRHSSLSGCKFCRMLASNGAVYRQETARFASHPHCSCTAAPVFAGESGEEATVLQYVASQRRRTDSQRQALRDYLAAMPD